MKNLPLALAILLLASSARAVPVILSATRAVTISGSARGADGGQSYLQPQVPSSQFAPFSATLSDQANWHFPFQGHDWPVPLHAESDAMQTSWITPTSFAVGQRVSTETWYPLPAQGSDFRSSVSAFASSVFHVDFRLLESTGITLGVAWEWSAIHETTFSRDFSLNSLGGGIALDFSDLSFNDGLRASYPGLESIRGQYGYTGLLPAGDYRLIFDISMASPSDPFGSFGHEVFGLNVQFATPDTGSTWVLFALSLTGIIYIRRRTASG
jgi:hypothetical protein